jgi:hypothetical protein
MAVRRWRELLCFLYNIENVIYVQYRSNIEANRYCLYVVFFHLHYVCH